MGVFYPEEKDLNKYNASSSDKKELIAEYAEEALKIAQAAENSIFPEFLWEIQMNEFTGDDYKLRGTCENAHVMEAYRLKRKYSNYWDYLDAMQVYYAYAEYIESAYGSFEMMKNAAMEGYETIYIPKMPKLTNKKKNRDFLWTGFLPCRVDEDFVIDPETIDAMIQTIPTNELDESYEYELPKQERRLQEQVMVSKGRRDRVNSIYAASSGTRGDGLDAIINFLNQANTGSIDARAPSTMSVSEIIDDLHEFDDVPPDIVEYMLSPHNRIVYNGMLADQKQKEQLEILEALVQAGFDFLDSDASKGIKKENIRAMTRKYGLMKNPADMTPKERKRYLKQMAKMKRNQQERLLGDRRMTQSLLLNRVQFSRQDSTGFRLCDVIPDE